MNKGLFEFPDKPREHGQPCMPARNDWELHQWFAEGMPVWKLAHFLKRTPAAVERDIDRYARDYEGKYSSQYQPTPIRPSRIGCRFSQREKDFIAKCVAIRDEYAKGETPWAIQSMTDCAKVLMRTVGEITPLWSEAEKEYVPKPERRSGLLG